LWEEQPHPYRAETEGAAAALEGVPGAGDHPHREAHPSRAEVRPFQGDHRDPEGHLAEPSPAERGAFLD